MNTPEPIKQCSRCKSIKPLSGFHKNKSTKDGHQSLCKECMNAANAESAEKHRDSKLERNRQYMAKLRKDDPEKARDAQRKWYESKGLEYHREWQKANRQTMREVSKRWRESHPEESRHGINRARVTRLGLEPHTLEQWLELLAKHGNKCLRCGSQEQVTVDHVVPLSKGGTDQIENIQPLCKKCNASKGKKTDDYRPPT